MEENFLKWLTLLCFGAAMVGAVLLVIGPNKVRAAAVFTFGVVSLAILFLHKNPNIIESFQKHIALTLIGMVIAGVSIITKLKK